MAKVSFTGLTLHHGKAISKPIKMRVFFFGGGEGGKPSCKAKKHHVLNRHGNLNSF